MKLRTTISVAVIAFAGIGMNSAFADSDNNRHHKVTTVRVKNVPLPVTVENPTEEVTVNNSNLDPVPVTGVFQIIDPATEAFQADASCLLGGGSGCTSDIFTVPSGKRAVVEYASVSASLTVDNGVRASVRTTLNSVEVNHQLYGSEVSPVPIIGGRRAMTAGQVVRLYADPETTIRMTGGTLGSSTSGIDVSVNFTISGHLVDMP